MVKCPQAGDGMKNRPLFRLCRLRRRNDEEKRLPVVEQPVEAVESTKLQLWILSTIDRQSTFFG